MPGKLSRFQEHAVGEYLRAYCCYACRVVVVCDSAFETRGELKGKLVKLKGENEGFAEMSYEKSLTHLRQASEWGNGMLVNAWRRLKAPLPTNNKKRAPLMWSCILMHNFRTETCERNQILTYFDNIIKNKLFIVHITFRLYYLLIFVL